MKFKAYAIAAAALCGVAASAQAAQVEPSTAEVYYHDLDLSTPEGQEELDRRLDKAAKAVCGLGDVRVGTRIRDREARKCYKSALEQLNERIAKLTKNEAAGG